MTIFSREEIQAIAGQIMTYPYKLWGFGEGIALEAVWLAAAMLDEPGYQAWVIEMMDRWLDREPRLREADHSAPGGLLLQVYGVTQESRYLALAVDLAAHMQQLPSADSGAWLHRPQHPDYHHFMYVDCMEVDAPFLCHIARVTGEKRYYDLAAEQLLGYCHYLQDESTGLFYHQYDAEQDKINGIFWGRGNGWALLGLLKSLLLLPIEHHRYSELIRRFQQLSAGIATCQLPSGDWPTVLTEPLTQTEGSLSALYAYGLIQGVKAGLLPDTYDHVISQAYDVLRTRLQPDGCLAAVSIATPPGDSVAHYDAITAGGSFPWGQGPLLLAALHRMASD